MKCILSSYFPLGDHIYIVLGLFFRKDTFRFEVCIQLRDTFAIIFNTSDWEAFLSKRSTILSSLCDNSSFQLDLPSINIFSNIHLKEIIFHFKRTGHVIRCSQEQIENLIAIEAIIHEKISLLESMKLVADLYFLNIVDDIVTSWRNENHAEEFNPKTMLLTKRTYASNLLLEILLIFDSELQESINSHLSSPQDFITGPSLSQEPSFSQ